MGLSESLAGANRASLALTLGGLGAEMVPRYQRDAAAELGRDARAGAGAMRWLSRAGARGPAALARARQAGSYVAPFSGGILGLPSPAPSAALGSARWAAAAQWLTRLFLEPVPQAPRTADPTGELYVVDDDDGIREALCSAVTLKGFSARGFADELSLFTAIERRRPRAILLDVVLRWVDGLRLCEQLHAQHATRDIPVFVMSGLDRPHLRERAIGAGARAFLAKPLDLDLLYDRLVALH